MKRITPENITKGFGGLWIVTIQYKKKRVRRHFRWAKYQQSERLALEAAAEWRDTFKADLNREKPNGSFIFEGDGDKWYLWNLQLRGAGIDEIPRPDSREP